MADARERISASTNGKTSPDASGVSDRRARLLHGIGKLRSDRSLRTWLAGRTLLVVSATLVSVGIVMITLGWIGVSRTFHTHEQIGYLISGGIGGLALCVIGSIGYFAHWLTVLIREVRRASPRVHRQHRTPRIGARTPRRPPPAATPRRSPSQLGGRQRVREHLAPILQITGLQAGYGRIEVLRGVDLEIAEGTVIALLGPNGAGKSTTIKAISGQIPITGGDVLIAGQSVKGASHDALARLGLCTVPEGRGIFRNLTVRENLRMMSYTGISGDDVEERAYATFPALGERRHQIAGLMSGGEQQMLALSRGIATDPAILLLDELSMGLAPLIVESLYDHVRAVAADGVSILMVEQFARLAVGVADLSAIMLNGRIVETGRPKDLEDALAAAYLGADAQAGG